MREPAISEELQCRHNQGLPGRSRVHNKMESSIVCCMLLSTYSLHTEYLLATELQPKKL